MRASILASAVAVVAASFALAPPALAQTPGVAYFNEPGAVGMSKTVEFSGPVTAIDRASRTITLKRPKGDEVQVIAGPEVTNFDQLKVGDVVSARYLEALVFELKKGGGLPVAKTEQSGTSTTQLGANPAPVRGRQVSAVGNVIAIDAATQTITVKGANRTVDMKVRDPDQLKLIAVGDQIEATYTEALAVALTPARQKR